MKKQRIELKDCGVTFLEDEHRYFLGETELSGITNAISTQLGLANAYDNIPTAILEKATQRGNEIHKSIQRFNNEWYRLAILVYKSVRHNDFRRFLCIKRIHECG